MLGDIITIVDKIFELSKVKGQKLTQIFEKIVAPLFEDMKAIHADQLKMFAEVVNNLSDPDLTLDNIIQLLGMRRMELKAIRDLTRSIPDDAFQPDKLSRLELLSNKLKRTGKPDYLNAFTLQVKLYFNDVSTNWSSLAKDTTKSMCSEPASILEILCEIRDFGSKYPLDESDGKVILRNHNPYIPRGWYSEHAYRRALINFVSLKIQELELRWSRVCDAYMELKIAVYK
jgi:hypothetical protein